MTADVVISANVAIAERNRGASSGIAATPPSPAMINDSNTATGGYTWLARPNSKVPTAWAHIRYRIARCRRLNSAGVRSVPAGREARDLARGGFISHQTAEA